MTAVTVVAAAMNEANQAREWVRHLAWVDRIVVVDTGSSDGTRELLEEEGVEVLTLGGSGPAVIHSAKNLGFDQVDGGWILDLDLDERVSLALRQTIEDLRSKDVHRFAAYTIPFRHYVFGRWLEHGGWRDRHLRLFRSGRVRYPVDRAHSTPVIDGETGDLSAEVFHFAHPRLHDFIVKMNRYTTQDAQLMIEHGRGGLRNRPPLPPSRIRWLRASLSVFWNRYVKAAGFRDGIPGFIVATLLATYAFVEQAKVWERRRSLGAEECAVPGEEA